MMKSNQAEVFCMCFKNALYPVCTEIALPTVTGGSVLS